MSIEKDNQKFLKLSLILITLHTAILLSMAFFRLVDGDEGWYLAAANSVKSGLTPYIDFFYPQMPYLPYFLSNSILDGFNTLYFSRIASVCISVLSALVFWRILLNISENSRTRLLLLFLYLFSGLVLVWYSAVKTYAWTNFLILVAFYTNILFARKNQMRFVIICGTCLALAVNIRLLLVPLLVFFPFSFFFNCRERAIKYMFAYSITILLVSFPSVLLFLSDPERFYFNNIGFHFIRNPAQFADSPFIQKLKEIIKLLLSPQSLLLVAAFIYAIAELFRNQKARNQQNSFGSPIGFAQILSVILVLLHFLPDPVHQQYFVQAFPLLLIAVAMPLERLSVNLDGRFWGVSKQKTLALLVTIYIIGCSPYIYLFTIGLRDQQGSFYIRNVKELCNFVEFEVTPGPVYSEWPGFPVLSGREGLQGLEYIGSEYPLAISEDLMRHYHWPVAEDLTRQIAQEQPACCIVYDQPQIELQSVIYENYTLARSFRNYKVYVLKK